MTERVQRLMIEQCERMLQSIKESPRWPGSAVAKSSDLRSWYSRMDEDTNKREVAWWEARLKFYKEAKVTK